MDCRLTAVMSQMSHINLNEPVGAFLYRAPACLCNHHLDLLRTNYLFIYFFEKSSNRLHEDREFVSRRQLG